MQSRFLRQAAAKKLSARVHLDPALESARSDSYPAPYPAGWYALASNDEIGSTPHYVEALGECFVLFRARSGRLGVLDAHCPHLGANLAGGEVNGECIECPFHKWSFDADGKVRHIPYAKRIPASLTTRSWPVQERGGLVCVYYDAEQLGAPFGQTADGQTTGRRQRPIPPYCLPRHETVESGEMIFRGQHDAGIVRMHVAELAENSADMAHFDVVHEDMFVPWSTLKLPGVRVCHRARWTPDDHEEHVAWFHDEVELELFGRRLPWTRGRAAMCMAGPCSVVTFDFELPEVGHMLLYQTQTPIAPTAQHVRFRWFAERRVPRALVWYVVGSWVSQWREDTAIWEHKVYRERPMLVPGDGPILAMRRWYARFYPSPKGAAR